MQTGAQVSGKSDAAVGNSPAVVVDSEVVDDHREPTRNDLILMGRASLADLTHNPDDYVDADVDRELRDAINPRTLAAIEYQWGRFIWWCGQTGRQHLPATPATIRQWIKDHWEMRRPDGAKRGRRGQPYSPRTVEQGVYLVSTVHQWLGYASPVRHPKVWLQLQAYEKKYDQAGFKADEAYAISHDQSVAIARHGCHMNTTCGLRNAAAFRAQFDTGLRASELLAVQMEDVSFETPEDAPDGYSGPLNVVLYIARSKTDQRGVGRTLGIEYVPGVDEDVDPAVLVARVYDMNRRFGFTSGPLWRECASGFARGDGSLAGSLSSKAWTYDGYEMAFVRAARRAGVDRDPKSGEKRNITSHSNRAGHVTENMNAGRPAEHISARTGHSMESRSFRKYWRNRRRFGATNTGTQIRRTRRRAQ